MTIQTVKQTVCAVFNLTEMQLVGPSRPERIVIPRMIAMALASEYTGKTHEEIGAAFGRAHNTVTHATKTFRDLYDTSSDFRIKVATCRLEIGKIVNNVRNF